MRRLLAALIIATAGAAASAVAQDTTIQAARTDTVRSDTAPAAPAIAPLPGSAAHGPGGARERPRGIVGRLLARLSGLEQKLPLSNIPMVRDVPAGPRTIAAGDTVTGPVAARGGTLDIYGYVNGDAVAYEGDVILRPGATVTGDAIAVRGRVRLLGGVVGGDARSVRGSLAPPAESAAAAPAEPPTVRGELELVVGWLTVLIIIGVGVLVFASGPLEGVVETLQRGFARSLLMGLAGQLAVLPLLLLVVVALAVTVLGILLIPFAIVAMVLGTAGLMMLGFLAVCRTSGGAIAGPGRGSSARRVRARGAGPGQQLTERGAALRALLAGIAAFLAVWLVAALLTPVPAAAALVRGLAFVLTWVAVTAGFGAALLSRAGTRRMPPTEPEPEPEEEISWQTPTPIGGVVAARRPTTSASSRAP